MVALYQNASAFIMPSLEEGFGLPLLEAMACGCSVISSEAASLKEIGGNAALYFDPKSEEDLLQKISSLLDNKEIQQFIGFFVKSLETIHLLERFSF